MSYIANVKSWFRKRYQLDGNDMLNSEHHHLSSNPKSLMFAVIRETPNMSRVEQIKQLSRIEGSEKTLKYINPIVEEGERYEEHVIECWLLLVNVVKDYAGVLFIATPDVISTDEVLVHSVMRTAAGLGVAITVLN